MNITLTNEQQAAFDGFSDFISDPSAEVFVIEGYAGTGKSTLVRYILDQLPKLIEAWRTLDPNYPDYEISLTSTTHKAVENLAQISGQDVKTIHSFLGLRLNTDYKTGQSELYPIGNFAIPNQHIVVIDEASYLNSPLLSFVFTRTKNCKIILIGDPNQLIDFKTTEAPAFVAGFPTVALTEVVRNGGQILELATACRNWVKTGVPIDFKPNGNDVVWLPHDEFNAAISAEFSRPDWKPSDSCFLAFQNTRINEYNAFINNVAKGDPDFQAGDVATVNSFFTERQTRKTFKTGESVVIQNIEYAEELGLVGKYYHFGNIKAFKPDSLKEWRKAITKARAEERFDEANKMQQDWVDLRAIYARTVHKSQGSTFRRVFIDLGDLGKCKSMKQLPRLLYVAFSRPTDQIIMTGDIV